MATTIWTTLPQLLKSSHTPKKKIPRTKKCKKKYIYEETNGANFAIMATLAPWANPSEFFFPIMYSEVNNNNNNNIITTPYCSSLTVLLLFLDSWTPAGWGEGSNPPSVIYIVFADSEGIVALNFEGVPMKETASAFLIEVDEWKQTKGPSKSNAIFQAKSLASLVFVFFKLLRSGHLRCFKV